MIKISNPKSQVSKLKFLLQRIKNLFHLLKAIFANVFFCFPSKKIKIIGVTGTDGKTTTTHLIYHILRSAGKRTSMISTIYARVGDQEIDTGFHTTTPSSFTIQKLIKKAVDLGDEYFVLETTSHALDQYRVWGIKFDIGVLTNITSEHLDYHSTFESYLETKIKLLLMSKIAVINEEDRSYPQIIKKLTRNQNIFGLGQELKIKKYHSKLKILNHFNSLSNFNKQNYAAAYTVGEVLRIPKEKIIEAFRSFSLPKGRMDLVYNGDFKIVIDFAHTPNAFSMVLPEIKKRYLNKQQGRLIHVFGCAGLRDFYKRPEMGRISSQFSDIIVLTEEDYRTEDIKDIFAQIKKGIRQELKKSKKAVTLLTFDNRQEAINHAIRLADKGDVVLITGKAHEKSLCRGRVEYPWDEFQAVKNGLKRRFGHD